MMRRRAERPGLTDWLILAGAVGLAVVFLLSDVSSRMDAARTVRGTFLWPFRWVLAYGGCPPDAWAEVERLRLALARRSLDRARLAEAERELTRLYDLLEFTASSSWSLSPLLVVERVSDRFGEVIVLSGDSPEAHPRQAVLGMEGLAGYVIQTRGREVLVRTLRNGAVQISARVPDSRHVGMLRWRPRERLLAMEGIPIQGVVAVDDTVFTSGDGRLYREGLPVGYVTSVRDDSTALVKVIRVRPAVDLDRAEELFLYVE
ncbi:MAG: rod shape-determining protein MreC [Candidatus Eisenbacteria sp.]|nr:rod shape-determining protein MreC [Candidatus Eisenbacteria bacterium]